MSAIMAPCEAGTRVALYLSPTCVSHVTRDLVHLMMRDLSFLGVALSSGCCSASFHYSVLIFVNFVDNYFGRQVNSYQRIMGRIVSYRVRVSPDRNPHEISLSQGGQTLA